MKYYYLTDTSEKSLAPFFSKLVLSAGFISVVIVGALLLLFWPRQPLAGFVIVNKIPLVFFLVFAATLIVHCYVNLCCGCGELIERHYFIRYRTDVTTFEREIDFLRYGLVEFLLHALILLLPFAPLLIVAASISAASLATFVKALVILYTAALLCRLFGFMVYLVWGRLSSAGYMAARAFMILFIFAAVFAPFINPLQLLYMLNESPGGTGLPFMVYTLIVVFANVLLVTGNHLLVKRHINTEKTA